MSSLSCSYLSLAVSAGEFELGTASGHSSSLIARLVLRVESQGALYRMSGGLGTAVGSDASKFWAAKLRRAKNAKKKKAAEKKTCGATRGAGLGKGLFSPWCLVNVQTPPTHSRLLAPWGGLTRHLESIRSMRQFRERAIPSSDLLLRSLYFISIAKWLTDDVRCFSVRSGAVAEIDTRFVGPVLILGCQKKARQPRLWRATAR